MTPLLDWLTQTVPRGAPTGAAGDTLSRFTDTIPDSLSAAAGAVRDTVTPPPLPGGVAAVARFFFQVPQWIQIGGAAVGAVVAVLVLRLLWRRRADIFTWLRTRNRQVQLALAAVVLAVIAVGSFVGLKSWKFMMHDNAFCSGCHVMDAPFNRFATGAGKHQTLGCHNCHQQGMYANVRQLVLWVADRPEKIGAHAPVPNARCEGCHQVQGGRERWQHIRRLAGHRVHLESDSTALKNVTCVKCHGAEVHRFVPSTRTCGQSGCHEKQAVKLAGMATIPEIKCTACHAFRADLPGLATLDSARRAMVPTVQQCTACHQMEGRPKSYEFGKDPHKGSCGSCHDVHSHRKPADALASCDRCHGDKARNAFHNGVNHRRVREQCLTCHLPHSAAVDPSDCVGCHNSVRQRGLFKAPLPFDTGAVLRKRPAAGQPAAPSEGTGPAATPPGSDPGGWTGPAPLGSGPGGWSGDGPAADGPVGPEPEEGGPESWGPSALADDPAPAGRGDALPETDLPRVRASPAGRAAVPADSFPHPRHKSLPCLTCHVVNRPGPGGGLVFQVPRGCDLCHHQQLIAGRVVASDCARCHRSEVLAAPHPAQIRVAVGARPPVSRPVGFRHERHAKVACATCHLPESTTPPDSVRTCTACHDQHHADGRDCVQCHAVSGARTAHTRSSHAGCDACHTPARIAALTPSRGFCLTCHEAQRDHVPGRECSTCHFLMRPADYRSHLLRRPPP